MALSLACAATSPAPLHRELDEIWHDYRALPSARALVVAGDPRRDRWVAGASGGHASLEKAERAARAQCLKRPAQRRLRAACVPYALGDEIVWKP